jgi:hypothetical protein
MMPGAIDYPAGNGNILKFNDSAFQRFSNNQLIESGIFTLIKDTTFEESVCLVLPAGQFSNRIVYNGKYDSIKVFIQIANNKLTFISGCYALDGGLTKIYQRIKRQQ